MKRLKRTIRICSLILFMILAATGIGIFGIAPTLTKDQKLFTDIEVNAEADEKADKKNSSVALNSN